MSLPLVWRCSHVLFAVAMLSTFFVTTVRGATVVVMVTGVPWACAMWAPFAIVGEELTASTDSIDEGEHGDGDEIEDGEGDVIGGGVGV
jgi:solute carrier family 45 protein 1/2/4